MEPLLFFELETASGFVSDNWQKLQELHENGILTKEQYEDWLAQILGE